MAALLERLMNIFHLFRVHQQNKVLRSRLTQLISEHKQAVKEHEDACAKCVRETARIVAASNAITEESIKESQARGLTETHLEIER